MRVGLVGQKDNRRASSLVTDICARLRELDVEPRIDETTAGQLPPDALPEAEPAAVARPVEAMADCDLVVSIGGDGTFLFAARDAGSTPVMGVNLGEVGFLNAVPPEAAVDAVAAEVSEYRETGTIETRDMPRIEAAGESWSLPPALNEIVVQGPYRGHGGGIGLEVRVDGSLYTSGYADGVLIATPTGSTAYNLSEGGPLVHPSVATFVVTEMCAVESMPPLTVDTGSEITVRLDDAETAYAVSDGRVREELDPPTAVTLARADEPIRIAGPPLDFFAALGKLE